MSRMPDGSSRSSLMRTRSALARAGLATLAYVFAVAAVAGLEPAANVRDLSLVVWASGAFALFIYLVRIAARRGAFREPLTGTMVLLLLWCAVMAAGLVAFQFVQLWAAPSKH